jgi:hypothetical protein
MMGESISGGHKLTAHARFTKEKKGHNLTLPFCNKNPRKKRKKAIEPIFSAADLRLLRMATHLADRTPPLGAWGMYDAV